MKILVKDYLTKKQLLNDIVPTRFALPEGLEFFSLREALYVVSVNLSCKRGRFLLVAH